MAKFLILLIIIFVVLPLVFGGQEDKKQRERLNQNKPKKYPR